MRSRENSLIEATFTEASATAPPQPKRLSARWPERRRRQAGVRAWRAGLGWALPTSLDWARFSTQKRTPKPTSRLLLRFKARKQLTIFTGSDYASKSRPTNRGSLLLMTLA